jgi:hypothetical protein
MEIKRSFTKGVMNKSLDDRLLPDGFYRDASNIKVSSTEGDDAGTVQNYLGNTEKLDIDTLLTDAGFVSQSDLTPIGSYTDTQNNDIYWFITSTTYDIIAKYHETNDGTASGKLILVETKSGGIMNFNQDYLITGVNLIDSKFLYFTDGLNPPRRIDVSKEVYRDNNISVDTVNVIVKPPLDSPTITLVSDDTNSENNLEDKFVRFAYRYIYKTNEVSALSPFSKTAFEAQEFKFDFNTGRNESMRNNANKVRINFDKGSDQVKKIEIVMKDSRDKNVVVVGSIDREDTNEQYDFANNKINRILPDAQVNRLFDNVPLSAKAQDLIGRRIVYGNYKQFFDIQRNGVDIKPNFSLKFEESSIADGESEETFKSGRDYELGVAYLDDFGRMSTVIESEKNTVHIPITSAKKKNDLLVNISNQAPSFASKYRLFLKQSRGTYYNIIPLLSVRDGLFIYFQIARYDIDKVKEGDYIYIKSTPKDRISFEEKFKVLEVENKERDFLKDRVKGWQDPGVYIKIKVENNILGDEFTVDQNIYTSRAQTVLSSNPLRTSSLNNQENYQNHVDFNIPHYGNGNLGARGIAFNSDYNFDKDFRFVLEITDTDRFRYREYDSSDYIEENVLINSYNIPGFGQGGNRLSITYNGRIYVFAYILWDEDEGYTIGDTYRVNCRGKERNINNNPIKHTDPKNKDGAFVRTPFEDIEIKAGTVITINIFDNNGEDQGEQRFISSSSYDSIEEWYYEELIYEKFKQLNKDGKDIGGKTVFFRRGNVEIPGPNNIGNLLYNVGKEDGIIFGVRKDTHIVMYIKGQFFQDNFNFGDNIFTKMVLKVQTPDSLTILETEGQLLSDDVYYELPKTYPINGGLHGKLLSTDTAQTLSRAAEITIEDFNAISFGNGMESSVIEDDWNGPELLPSPRASASIDRYEQIQAENSLTYSGIYNESSSTNDLNEFNLSLANFKALEEEYGPIQKLYARDTDLIVFQEDKVSKVLFGKNLLSDSVGGGSITSIPQVLGTQIPYTAEFGMSNNPESFAKWGNDIFFTDEKRGAVLNLTQSGIKQISTYGMRSYFRNLFDDQAGKQKLGAYDPYEFKYVLAWNDKDVSECDLSVSPEGPILVSGDSFTDGTIFVIQSNTTWSISVAQTGGWLTLNTTSGEGNQVIKGSVSDNTSNTTEREATITVTYCDGQTIDIVFVQSYKAKKKVVVVTKGNGNNDGGKSVKPEYDSTEGSYEGGRTPLDFGGEYFTYDPLEDFVGNGGVPNAGDDVDIIGDTLFEDSANRPLKPFNPNLGNKMYYLDSDTIYTADQGDDLVAAATEVTPTLDVDKYKGTFTYNANNDNLYLVIDYTNNLDMSTSVTSIPTSGTDLPEAITLNNSSDIGRYTVTYSSTSTNIRFVVENAAGAIIADSGYVSTPSSDTFTIVKRNTGSDVIKVYGPQASETYDIALSAVSLTSFTISDAGYETVDDACASSTTETAYHNGSGATPVIGSFIYSDSSGSTLFDGDNLFYEVGSDALRIDSNGVVLSIDSCTCSETAIPVIDSQDLIIQENDNFVFSISATNNPTSFSLAGNCREFDLFGGNGGAVFEGQDCTTGVTKQVSVSSGQLRRMCFFIGTVSKIGGADDATFTDIGGCSSDSIPDGMIFTQDTGTISGVPTEPGDFDITVTATNCFGTSSETTFTITVKPERAPNPEFQMDTTNPQTSSANACAIGSPSYSTMYHNGILEYPVIYDMVFSDPEGLNLYNGNNQWFLTESGVAILVDADGIVNDTFLCGITTPTPPTYSSVSLAYGADASAACSNTTFTTYYYDGTLGVNPGNLYDDAAGTTPAAAGNYKYDTGGGFIQFPWDGTSWSAPVDCP